MTDAEIRKLLLRKYYEMRRQGFFLPKPEDFDGALSQEDILHCSDQLGQLGLIVFKSLKADIGGIVAGAGRITAYGVDAVEGTTNTDVTLATSTKGNSSTGSSNEALPGSNSLGHKYEVAISFAGEDRTFAEALAKALRETKVEVFYDDFYTADLWGKDLSVEFRKVFHESSRFCIMVISPYYLDKMWTTFERQQAIERLIREKGSNYILPVRLDGFTGEVPGLSGMIHYLHVNSDQSQLVVSTFLEKVGRKPPTRETMPSSRAEAPKLDVSRLNRSFTDREKKIFLKNSFEEIMNLIEKFLSDTKNEHSQFDYNAEKVSREKCVFTLYSNQKLITQFKIWLGGALGNEISFRYGSEIDIDDGSTDASIYLEEHDDELKLKPLRMGMFDKSMSPQEVAEYLWGIVTRTVS